MKKEVVIKSALPYYLAGLVWLLYSLVLPFYRLMDFFLAAVLTVAVFWISRRLLPGHTELVDVPEEAVLTGDQLADEMVATGQALLKEIRVANDKIAQPELSAQIDELEDISRKIFNEIIRRPKKAPEIRRFLGYYLPVVLKLLDTYSNMNAQDVGGENIGQTLKKIEGMMDKVLQAFRNQLDSLFHDEALDASTDITVLEGMLAREGLLTGELREDPSAIHLQ